MHLTNYSDHRICQTSGKLSNRQFIVYSFTWHQIVVLYLVFQLPAHKVGCDKGCNWDGVEMAERR